MAITHFYHNRDAEVLNIRAEKTTEDCLVAALSTTLKTWGDAVLADYACAESVIVDIAESLYIHEPLP